MCYFFTFALVVVFVFVCGTGTGTGLTFAGAGREREQRWRERDGSGKDSRGSRRERDQKVTPVQNTSTECPPSLGTSQLTWTTSLPVQAVNVHIDCDHFSYYSG